MEVIYLLIPLSIVLVLVIVAGFLWAINHAQFEDLERHGQDILLDDEHGVERAPGEDPRPAGQ